MRCLHCGKNIPLLRKLTDQEFCSGEHRSAFQAAQKELARQVLEETGGRLKARQAPSTPAKPGRKRAETPRPDAPPLASPLPQPWSLVNRIQVHTPPTEAFTPRRPPGGPDLSLRLGIAGIGRHPLPLPAASAPRQSDRRWPSLELTVSSPSIAYEGLRRAVALHRERGLAAAPLARFAPGTPRRAAASAPRGQSPEVLSLTAAAHASLLNWQRPSASPASAAKTRAVEEPPLAERLLPGRLPGPCAQGLRKWTGSPSPLWDDPCAASIPSAETVPARPALTPQTRRELAAPLPHVAARTISAATPFWAPAATPPKLLAASADSAGQVPAPGPIALQHGTAAGFPLLARTEQAEPLPFPAPQAAPVRAATPTGATLPRQATAAMMAAPVPVPRPSQVCIRAAAAAAWDSRPAFRAPGPEPSEALWDELLDAITAPAPAPPSVAEDAEPAPAPLLVRLMPVSLRRPLERPRPAGPHVTKPAALWATALEPAPRVARPSMRLDQPDGSGPRPSPLPRKPLLERFRLPQWPRFGGVWRHAPADLKWVSLAIPAVLGLVIYSLIPGRPMKVTVAPVEVADAGTPAAGSRLAALQQVIMERAAISLVDDFRSGLGAWSGGPGWAKTWNYDKANFVAPGQLALYSPTAGMRDYSVTFLAQIDRRSLNWVVRAADENNFHAIRIVITQPGPLPKAVIMRYPVVDGKRGRVTTLPLPLTVRADTLYKVRMEIRGDNFITYVQDQVVDSFTDGTHAEGGIGFFSPPGDRALLRWVSVMHQYDYLGRLCALLTPYTVKAEGRRAE